MGLSKNITLTIKDYEIKLDKEIKFYENDTIDLCFSILEYGIEVKDGISINKLMPIQALRSYMLIETPHGIDYAESTKIEDNKIVFNLGTKYSQFVGVGRMQIVVKDSDGCRVTLPEFEFEIKESINMNWDRESFDFLATEDDSIIIDEFGRKIHMSKISDMPESENLSEESYAMIIDEEGNKRFKIKAIADAVEDSLDVKFDAYTDELNGNVEEFKDSIRADVTTLANENNTFKNQVDTRLANYGSDYNSFKDNVEARLGEHMTDYNRFKDGVETRIEENENAYDGFVSNVSTVLDNYGSTYNAFKSEVNRANASFQSTLNASNQIFKNEMVDRYDNFVYKIDEDIFEGGRTDYFGETHETIRERLELDFDNVHRRIDESELLDYEGYAITADSSYYGLQRETKIQGRTLQNLVPTKIFNDETCYGSLSSDAKLNGTTVSCIASGGYRNLFVNLKEFNLLKQNTDYTIILTIHKNTLEGEGNLFTFSNNEQTIQAFDTTINTINNGLSVGTYKFVGRLKNDISACTYLFRTSVNSGATSGEIEFSYYILEGDHTQTPLEELPFVEGIESTGDKSKNLVDTSLFTHIRLATGDIGSVVGFITENNMNRFTNTTPIKIKRNARYSFKIKEGYQVMMVIVVDEVITQAISWTNNFSDKELIGDYIFISTRLETGNPITDENILEIKESIQLEESSHQTAYEPYHDGYKISGKAIGKNLYNGEVINNIALNIDGSEVNSLYSQLARYIAVKPNTNYIFSNVPSYADRKTIIEYDEKKRVIRGYFANSDYSFKTGHDTRYITLYFYKGDLAIERSTDINLQLEEGTTVTAYEPYKESTYSYILDEPLRSLPSGVCDTIDLETGVLTRRVGKAVLDGTQKQWTIDTASPLIEGTLSFDNQRDFGLGKKFNYGDNPGMICDKFPGCSREGIINNKGGISDYNGGFRIRIQTANLETEDVQGFIKWLSDNPVTVYYELATPTTEQLSEQRINSFDGITHVISDNKIMPKITTRIPTDLGNNVNNRLNNLNDKIDDHKNETDNACIDYFGYDHPSLQDRLMSDFDKLNTKIEGYGYISYEGTSIYATNTMEGSVNNTVVKGRTLQNLRGSDRIIDGTWANGEITFKPSESTLDFVNFCFNLTQPLKNSTQYTLVYYIKTNTLSHGFIACEGGNSSNGTIGSARTSLPVGATGIVKHLITTKSEGDCTFNSAFCTKAMSGEITFYNRPLILEGDHTQTPIEELPYVEGIESVGESELTDDGYKISGKSCGKNLFNGIIESGNVSNINGLEYASDVNNRTGFIRVEPNKVYVLSKNGNIQGSNIYYFSKDKKFLFHETETTIYTPKECEYIRLTWGNTTVTSEDILQLNEGTEILPYEPYQESTYSYILNEPLRSLPNGVCDTIDFETGVLTRRVGKRLLNNLEVTWYNSETSVDGITLRRGYAHLLVPAKGGSSGYCNKLSYYQYTSLTSKGFSFHPTSGTIHVILPVSELKENSLEGLKQWLVDNSVTVYYELATPTTEQLTPQQLKSFDTTTHIISNNKLMPIVSTKIPTDLGAMVNTLSLRNRELEEVNGQQDELIDITMMATDEMYSMLEPLMEAVEPMGLLDCSKMAQMYVAMVRRGIKKIEDVPRRYQEEVREALGIKIEEEEWGEDDGIK